MRRNAAWAAVLLALALMGAGCAHSLGDDQIATNVRARMFSDPQLKGTALRVVVKDGVATLSGEVPSVSARYEAFKVATETAGVKRVTDDMTVELPPMSGQTAANAPPAELAPEPKPRHVSRPRAAAREEPAPAPDANEPSQPPDQSAAGQPPQPADQTAGAQSETTPSAPAPELPPPVVPVTVPQGTKVSVRMIDTIDSSVNHTGDIFHAALVQPIVVDHKVVAPKNTNVYLRLVQARSAGHISGQSELRVELYRIQLQGRSYPVVSNDYIVKGAKRGKRSALAIIGGAAIGAAIGAIAGGGKGAAIGAAAGGGGGAVYQEATKGQQVQIPSETVLNFKLQQPVAVTPMPPTPGQPGPDQNPGP